MRIGLVYINLMQSDDRRARFKVQWKRFPAVNAKRIHKTHPAFNILRESVNDTVKYEVDKGNRDQHYSIDRVGAIGCSLSHIAIWQLLSDDSEKWKYRLLVDNEDPAYLDELFRYFVGLDAVVVIEDDANVNELGDDPASEIFQIVPDTDWDVCLLGEHPRPPQALFKASSQWVAAGTDYAPAVFSGSHAYIVTKRGAKILLATALPISMHVDYYMSVQSQLGNIRIVRSPMRVGTDFDSLIRHGIPRIVVWQIGCGVGAFLFVGILFLMSVLLYLSQKRNRYSILKAAQSDCVKK